jgi:hypothetical protein
MFALTLLDRKMFVSKLSKLFFWTSVYVVFREAVFWKSFTSLSVFDLAALRFLILAILSLFVFTVLVQSNFEFSYRLRKVLFILITLNVFGYVTGISYNSPIEGEGRAFLWPTTVIVYLSFFYLEKRKFISSLIMFTSVLITQSRALYMVLSIFITKLLFKKGGVLFFFFIFLLVSLNSEFLFQRFVDNSVKEDARNIEINALMYKIKLEPYILLVGQPFSVQIWDGMLEEGGIMDSDLAWAIYNKYDVHNYFLVSNFNNFIFYLVMFYYLHNNSLLKSNSFAQ